MPRYMLLALNGPVAGEGKEEAYNKWYDEVHLPDLKAIAGVVSARRFKVVQRKMPAGADWPYVAAYEIETEDLAAVMQRMATEPRPFDPAFDRSGSGHILAIEVGGS